MISTSEPVFKRRDIVLYPQGAKRLDAASKSIELLDGNSVDCDYLVIATGPELAFDGIAGFGPSGETQCLELAELLNLARQRYSLVVSRLVKCPSCPQSLTQVDSRTACFAILEGLRRLAPARRSPRASA